MKPHILTIIFTLTVCTILSAQVKKDSLEFYGLKFSFINIRIMNNQVYDTSCYQVQYITPHGRLYTDSINHCKGGRVKMYFPIQYSSLTDTIKVDTFDILSLYDGLQQFKEPIIWNSAELDNSIRITIFNDTLPEVFRLEISNSNNKVIKKTATFGHRFYDIDKGYTEKTANIKQHRINRIKKDIEEIINEHICAYKYDIHGKNTIIETKFNNKYEFIITDDLMLSVLKQHRKFKRILHSLE
jgi:hypothetical protein